LQAKKLNQKRSEEPADLGSNIPEGDHKSLGFESPSDPILLFCMAREFNNKAVRIVIVLVVLLIGISFLIEMFTIRFSPQQEALDFIKLPSGFKIEIFAEGEGFGGQVISTPGPNNGPRMLEFDSEKNTVYVTVPKQSKVFALEDKNKDSKLDENGKKIFIDNLNKPHGIALYQDWVYIAEENRVIRVKDLNNDNAADMETLEVLTDLPAGGHFTRTIRIINDSLFISIGSSCNVCIEENKRRGTIEKCDLDGKNCKTYARGLRNAVDFNVFEDSRKDFNEFNGKIFATDNGRDGLGNNIPPEEVNIVEEGKNYGWPICYGNKIHDSEFDKNVYIRDPCEDTEASFIDLAPHVAPLGFNFYLGNKFPNKYKGKMFIAYHGSWDSDVPVGYKIVTVDLKTKEVADFATGWIEGSIVKGRPVGVMNFRDGLLMSDDNKGLIYRIYYSG